jgi:hypothetical protein
VPEKNAARRNGKAWKKHPGVSKSATPGRTTDGYSSEALERRAIRRATYAAANPGKVNA